MFSLTHSCERMLGLSCKVLEYKRVSVSDVRCKIDVSTQTGKFENCVPKISQIYYELYRKHQNCMPKISVARYKLSRLGEYPPWHNLLYSNYYYYIHKPII